MTDARRWVVLAAYAVAVGMSQLLWLNFAPLLTLIQQRYGVGELTASALVGVFPLLYLVLSLPAGALIDRPRARGGGYRVAVGLGAWLMAAGACLRIFDQRFAWLLTGQIVIAVAQPFVVNGISKLVADWFEERHSAVATGLGTMGMFLGMAVGLAATPAAVAAWGLRRTMIGFAVAAVGVAIVTTLLVRPRGADVIAPPRGGFRAVLANGRLRVLFVVSFLGMGVFNGLTTWLEQILAPHGIDAGQAGLVGGALIVGGIVGAVVLPALADATRRRRPFLFGAGVAALLTLNPLCTSGRYHLLLWLGLACGFFLLPLFALLLDASAQLAGVAWAGAATSLLMLAGNAGGVAVVVALPLMKRGGDFSPGVALLIVLLAGAALLCLRAPDPERSAPGAGAASAGPPTDAAEAARRSG